jgi:hypothetical protein
MFCIDPTIAEWERWCLIDEIRGERTNKCQDYSRDGDYRLTCLTRPQIAVLAAHTSKFLVRTCATQRRIDNINRKGPDLPIDNIQDGMRSSYRVPDNSNDILRPRKETNTVRQVRYAPADKISSAKSARSRGSYLRVSFKNTRETAQAINGWKLQRAVKYLENVQELKEAVPMRRYAGSTGRSAQGTQK